MNADELRAFIIEQINNLDKKELLQLESFIDKLNAENLNELNETTAQYGLSEWEKLSETQRLRIHQAQKSLREKGGTPHDIVMKEMRARYGV